MAVWFTFTCSYPIVVTRAWREHANEGKNLVLHASKGVFNGNWQRVLNEKTLQVSQVVTNGSFNSIGYAGEFLGIGERKHSIHFGFTNLEQITNKNYFQCQWCMKKSPPNWIVHPKEFTIYKFWDKNLPDRAQKYNLHNISNACIIFLYFSP